MDVLWITDGSARRATADDVANLLARDDGFVWVDIPECDETARSLLSDAFGFHPLAVQDCTRRTHVPKVHAYPDHTFLILHAPEPEAGHVHLLELDQFIGNRFLVTVHGPLGAGVSIDTALRETRAILTRMESGRFRPASPFALSYAIVSAMARRMEGCVTSLAGEIAALERKVATDTLAKPERLVGQMFRLRHQVLTISTMAAQSREVYKRVAALARIPSDARSTVADLQNQFDAVRNLSDGEERFLQGVVDFYQNRVATELNQFAKRLTSIGAILLVDTLIAGIYGMNFVYMPEIDWRLGYPFALGLMVAVAAALAWYFRRKHWL
jgi:magnesium/cobalt transport protein CorA